MRAWRLTTLVLGGLALVMATTQVIQAFYSLPELRLAVLPQLPPTFAFRLLWPLFLLALVFGTASCALFARTARLRWGFMYAAVLGYGIYFLMGFAITLFAISPLNEFIFALVLMNRPETQTAPVWLQAFNEGARGTDWGGVMAGSTVMALPVVIFFLIVQRRVTAGLTAGAVKG